MHCGLALGLWARLSLPSPSSHDASRPPSFPSSSSFWGQFLHLAPLPQAEDKEGRQKISSDLALFCAALDVCVSAPQVRPRPPLGAAGVRSGSAPPRAPHPCDRPRPARAAGQCPSRGLAPACGAGEPGAAAPGTASFRGLGPLKPGRGGGGPTGGAPGGVHVGRSAREEERRLPTGKGPCPSDTLRRLVRYFFFVVVGPPPRLGTGVPRGYPPRGGPDPSTFAAHGDDGKDAKREALMPKTYRWDDQKTDPREEIVESPPGGAKDELDAVMNPFLRPVRDPAAAVAFQHAAPLPAPPLKSATVARGGGGAQRGPRFGHS